MMRIGFIALFFSLSITGLALYGLIGFDGASFNLDLLKDAYIQKITLFSIKQAFLSTVLSVIIALPIAQALYYLPNLRLKSWFLALCLLCFIFPSLVLITGLVALVGQAGWLTPYLGKNWSLYGLHGIVLAHVFLNMPYAVRVFYLQLQSIPESSWRLARQLKLSYKQQWLILEWPVLGSVLPSIIGIIFIICFNSFAVVLALGGGPQATTLELAIYQALKYDFNPSDALTLAWLQLFITGSLLIVVNSLNSVAWLSTETPQHKFHPKIDLIRTLFYHSIYWIAWVMLSLPLMTVAIKSLQFSRLSTAWLFIFKGLFNSLVLGLSSALLCLLVSYGLLQPLRQWNAKLGKNKEKFICEWLVNHTLIVPTMVISVGLYILLLKQVDFERWGWLIVIIVNAQITIPFVLNQLKARLFLFDQQYSRLINSLKLAWQHKIYLEWQWAQNSILSAFIIGLVLALGDVAIFSLFGHNDWPTLSWSIYNYASTYRMKEAIFASSMLLILCLGLTIWLERINRVDYARA